MSPLVTPVPSKARAALHSITALLILEQKRERAWEAKQRPKKLKKKKKGEKLKNSLSCPEPRKESKQPLLRRTLPRLPAGKLAY